MLTDAFGDYGVILVLDGRINQTPKKVSSGQRIREENHDSIATFPAAVSTVTTYLPRLEGQPIQPWRWFLGFEKPIQQIQWKLSFVIGQMLIKGIKVRTLETHSQMATTIFCCFLHLLSTWVFWDSWRFDNRFQRPHRSRSGLWNRHKIPP